MKLIGLMPVRNEDWILGLTARAALMWCDALVILDHASTDQTNQIAYESQRDNPQKEIAYLREDDPTWHEQAHRQRMLEVARKMKATHIVTIDADELLTGNLLPDIRDMIEVLSPGEVLQLPWIATRLSGRAVSTGYINDQVDPFLSPAWKDDPRYHWSAEIRNGYDYHRRAPFIHGADNFSNFSIPLKSAAEGGFLHLQFVSTRRLLAKHALYQMQEAIRWPGRFMGNPDPEATRKVREMYGHTVARLDNPALPCPAEWWEPYAHLMQHMDPYKEPWQVAECKRLMIEYGPEKFAGLDLFGIV